MELGYKAPPVISAFMQSNARRRYIQGPFGSGKSTGCCFEIVRRALMHPHYTDGLRHTRFIITRNTTPQLRDTTMKTWFRWFPNGSIGDYRATERTYYIKLGDVRSEVIFRALDNPDDISNLLSLEITGAWLNEGREMNREIVDGIDGRLGRWYKMDNAWMGMFADTNPPLVDSYWYALAEGLDPETMEPLAGGPAWDTFFQPSGLADDAENIENLPTDYYKEMMKGKDKNYITMYVHGRYGRSLAGTPVQPQFDRDEHVAEGPLHPIPTAPVIVAFDFGRTPACTFEQQDAQGRVVTLDEIVTLEKDRMGLERMLRERVIPKINQRFAGIPLFVTGDPTGGYGTQVSEKTCVDIFVDYKFPRRAVQLAFTNDPAIRREATEHFLTMRNGALYDPRCRHLIRGLEGGYHYPKLRTKNQTSDAPEKNIYSHICEADEYAKMRFRHGVNSAAALESRKKWLAKLGRNPGYNVRT